MFKFLRSRNQIRRHNGKAIGQASHLKRTRKRRWGKLIARAAAILAVMATICGVLGGIVVLIVAQNLPDVETLQTYIPAETTKIYASDGTVLADLHQEENRVVIPLSRISPNIIRTVLAVEDTDFYRHSGFNIKGLLRAVIVDVATLSFAEGGSTLTQQLARNLFLSKHKSLTRKVKEILIAMQMERKYTKDEILEMYLNQVYWGHNSYGIESAAQLYFNKSADRLSVSESALLVGLLKGPELYSPFHSFENAKRRQRTVLNRMVAIGLLTPDQANTAYQERLSLAPKRRHRYNAPYFTSYIVNKLVDTYGETAVYTSGMKVYTTLDYKLQLVCSDVVKKYVDRGRNPYFLNGQLMPSLNYDQAAILVIDPNTGYVKAMQGGADYDESEFNRCIQAHRQPGSAFKPFVYLAALEKGFSPGSIIDDSPVSYTLGDSVYSPSNYTRRYLGPITLRKALEQSVNIVAVKLTNIIGPNTVVRVAHMLGIKSDLKPVLSLPLGANEVTMLELTSAYCALANGGVRIEPACILRIEDRNGVPLYENRVERRRIFDANLVYALVDMMKDVINYGTGQAAKLPRPIAGKTGTTSDYRDAWFMGFIPQLVCATWVGNDDNHPMNKVTGGSIPALMWKDVVKYAVADLPAQDFIRSKDLVDRPVDTQTGKVLVHPGDAQSPTGTIQVEKYWKGQTPSQTVPIPAEKKAADATEESVLDFFQMH